MKLKGLPVGLFCLLLLTSLAAFAQTDVSLWLTNSDRSALFERQTSPLPLANAPTTNQVINVDAAKTYQTMDGFGFALTGGSAQGHPLLDANGLNAVERPARAAPGERQ